MKTLKNKITKLDLITKIGLSILTVVNIPLIVMLLLKLTTNPTLHF
jgi:hypothetical protein